MHVFTPTESAFTDFHQFLLMGETIQLGNDSGCIRIFGNLIIRSFTVFNLHGSCAQETSWSIKFVDNTTVKNHAIQSELALACLFGNSAIFHQSF